MSDTKRNFTLKSVLPTRFVVMDSREEYPGVRDNCTLGNLRDKLADLDDLEIISVDYNGTGSYKEEGMFFGMFDHTLEEELPPYFTVKMKKQMPGDHVATMTAFLPTLWNERFFGVTGGGSASFLDYQQHLFALNTPWTVAVRNHFACMQTDCDIDFFDTDWGFKKDSTELDYDLIHYWGHIGAHDVADYCCPLRMTLRYYNNVISVTAGGSEEAASKFVKCCVSHGGGHGDVRSIGEVMAYPDTFAALVKWVEDRDARIVPIYEGTSEVQKLIIAREALKG